MRLIDADAFIEELEADAGHIESSIARMMHYAIIKDIEHAPTIDAVKVRHGRWIEYPECLKYESAYCDDDIVCSVCGYKWNVIDNNTEEFDYCPHCGARMDGGQDED